MFYVEIIVKNHKIKNIFLKIIMVDNININNRLFHHINMMKP